MEKLCSTIFHRGFLPVLPEFQEEMSQLYKTYIFNPSFCLQTDGFQTAVDHRFEAGEPSIGAEWPSVPHTHP